jgi:hypothetical protein
MKILLLILISLLGTVSYPQDLPFSIIENTIRRWQDTGMIIYVRNELPFSKDAKTILLTQRLRGTDTEPNNNVFRLNRNDKKLIRKQIESQKVGIWPDSLFANSKGIYSDSLYNILRGKDKGWQYFLQHFGPKYFEFSIPILLRNNAIAIFTIIDMSGPSSGIYLMYVYKKAGNQWKKFVVQGIGAW